MTTSPDGFSLTRRLAADHQTEALRSDVLKGLTGRPKTLPPKWFYDRRGSELFEQITRLPEYYPTRAEQEILEEHAEEIAAAAPARTLVELGSGSSSKTRLLLDALTARGGLELYAPLDVSEDALAAAGQVLAVDYPELTVEAAVTDYEVDLTLPGEAPRLVAFLGGTLGNLDAAGRRAFYATLRSQLGPGDGLLLGADLVKPAEVLVPAYDDAQGVTAEFNKNVLEVLNRELGATFDTDAFDHRALWNEEESRIEMRLRSRFAQSVAVPALDLTVEFERGEELRTEISVKFRREELTRELAASGFALRHWWTDSESRFALLLAEPEG
ncbi:MULTISPECIES: L-histidine N(alpha)-methyltransferase [unclassified Streptomyces]|uniref:L-histidine N(alpha)-methyltransferase n=1 Tax=unclassified Streptomyces TaxID=2593676 RepID=UPI0022B6CB97|nr:MULTISPECIES: L-histidine N(alpha)-methyltransferase [unclassified Streptomyces]MCZ7415110.1 L-histidine N(alpha)-methyltransferase [Streptomyces sp. WMMC897]MCZ7432053.1 L-histidine N(alpha)-methyltransferase [Streptomyces sp. WMMC1477]